MRSGFASSTRLVAAAGVAATAFIAVAIAISAWRYEDALSRSAAALETQTDSRRAEAIIGDFAQERLAMYAYLINPSSGALAEVATPHGAFTGIAAQLPATTAGTDDSPLAVRLRNRAVAGQRRYYAEFIAAKGLAGHGLARDVGEIGRLEHIASTVNVPLEALVLLHERSAVSGRVSQRRGPARRASSGRHRRGDRDHHRRGLHLARDQAAQALGPAPGRTVGDARPGSAIATSCSTGCDRPRPSSGTCPRNCVRRPRTPPR